MKRIIIIGGGPSGMMAAISSKLHNKDYEVILLEKNKELGRKLKLTGGGRCNVTANLTNEGVISSICKNGKFLYSSLTNFNTNDIINFFNSNDCQLKEEDHFRMFPITNKAASIVEALERKMNEIGVKIIFNSEVTDITNKVVKTIDNEYTYNYLIIGTGGITLPQTGSDGKGYDFAKHFGHSITELVPAEVPLVSNDEFIHSKVVQGLSFKDVTINVLRPNGKVKKSITHDLLFTHFGISGPGALRASFEVINELEKNETVDVNIDFLPKKTKNALINEISDLTNILKNNDIPERLVKYIQSVTTSDLEFIDLIKEFKVNIYTTRGFKHAFVTNGGVSLKEIDPKTMKSKLNNKVSFVGELLDINAYTGGFNITSALSTGFTAGKNVTLTF